MNRSNGFFASLFDLSFSSFITTKLIKVLYVLSLVGAGILCLNLILNGFANSVLQGLLMLVVVAPLAFLFFAIYMRVILELIIVVFRIAEHTNEIAKHTRQVMPSGD